MLPQKWTVVSKVRRPTPKDDKNIIEKLSQKQTKWGTLREILADHF